MLLNENGDTIEKDLCVSCWQETEYFMDTPVELRIGYIEGNGQWCKKCFQKAVKVSE
ncbi:MAG: hypothetical protein AAB362_03490 [Patescibacteria group bacterium]